MDWPLCFNALSFGLGEWGKMDVDRAWRFDARSKELLNIGSLRERLYVSSELPGVYSHPEIRRSTPFLLKSKLSDDLVSCW